MPPENKVYLPCRSDEGGEIKCKRGYTCRSVELRGRNLHDISISRETGDLNHTSTDCDIFIVFESPDRKDDLKGGIGFSRQMGKLIEFIDRAGIDKRKVWCSPLVRCQNFHKPSIQETNACIPHIIKEIEYIKPKAVILLGTGPLRLFKLHGKGGIKAIRGNVFNLPLNNNTYNVISTYDPLMFLKITDYKLESKIIGDYKKAEFLSNDTEISNIPYQTDFKVIKTLDDLDYMIQNLGYTFAFDTESRALPWSREPLICMSFSNGLKRNYILPIYNHDSNGLDWKLKPFWKSDEKKEIINLLKKKFEDPSVLKAAHNIKYDIHVLRKWLGIKVNGFLYDTMLMHHVLFETRPHDLEYLADIELNTGDYSKDLHEITGRGKVLKNKYDCVPDEMLWRYAAIDAECCWRLLKIYHKRLQEKPHLYNLYSNEVEPEIHSLAEAEWYGHWIDQNKLKVITDHYQTYEKNLLADIQSKTWKDFNPNSPKQVQKALIDAGFEENIKDKETPSGYTTNKIKLMEFQEESKLVRNLLEYRNITKISGTYINVIHDELDTDGRLRPSFLIHGTESGRYSCRLFHQIPRVDNKKQYNIKEVYAAPEGSKLVYFDYSQIELRVLAILANDREMIKIFYPINLQTPDKDADLHSATAATLLDIPIEKVNKFNRQHCGKNVNFGISYGSKGYRLVQTGQWEDEDGVRHPITWEMLNKGMERFQAKFYGLTAYLKSVPEITRKQNNTYKTPFGRERRIGERINDTELKLREAAEREIVNFSIQSTAKSINARTVNEVHKLIKKWIKDGEVFLVNTVHDSATWQVKDYLVDWFLKAVKIIAERPVPELSNTVFPCEIGVGINALEAETNILL